MLSFLIVCIIFVSLHHSFQLYIVCVRIFVGFIFVTVQKEYSAQKMVAFGGSYGGK